MRVLNSLSEGDSFRPAREDQYSLNNRKMDRSSTYSITKVYPMTPHTVIAVRDSDPSDGFYSLNSGTIVLLPKEFNPSDEQILHFLRPRGRKKVVGYKLLWNGKTSLHGVVGAQCQAIVKIMFVVGKKEYSHEDLVEIISANIEKFLPKQPLRSIGSMIASLGRHLVNNGLVEEIVDDAPANEAVINANLHGGRRWTQGA